MKLKSAKRLSHSRRGFAALAMAVFAMVCLQTVAVRADPPPRDCNDLCKEMVTNEIQKCANDLNLCFDACGRPADRTCGQNCFNDEGLCRFRASTDFYKQCVSICKGTPNP